MKQMIGVFLLCVVVSGCTSTGNRISCDGTVLRLNEEKRTQAATTKPPAYPGAMQ